jgi:molybdopterin-guanine dinucleotide biosynthesis protein MobB
MKQIPRLHIVGRKNAGKTTLVCALVTELSRQGYAVATVKHTHHHHELDTPGKDSHQHREAGAAGVGILAAEMMAAFIPMQRDAAPDDETRYARFNELFQNCDLILVEGDLHTSATKLEVWRPVVNEPPYAAGQTDIAAVITDDRVTVPDTCRTVSRSRLEDVIQVVLNAVADSKR